MTKSTKTARRAQHTGRREFMQQGAALAGLMALGDGSFALAQDPGARSIKVGALADITGALSFMGVATANVVKMVIDDINAKGGLLGRKVELFLERAVRPAQRRRGRTE